VSVRFTPRALAEAKRIKSWWRKNRPAAPDAFEEELSAALDRIVRAPGSGRLYEEGNLGVAVRRVLLPKTLNHVYYAVDGEDVVVLSVWGALHSGGPKM
jgi:plasmid stabilization system protein ParE